MTTTIYTGGAVINVHSAVVTPPPPPPPSGVITPVLVKTDQYAPKATPSGQTFVLSLHGSGGPQIAFGDQWTATVDEPYADHSMPMTWAAQGKADGIYLQPHDKYWRTPAAFFESYWIGCAVGTDLRLYTERRLDELMRQVTTQYPGASATKRVAAGGSMGAWGCMSYALRRPTMFAAVFASRPRWQWGGKAVTTSTGGVVYVDTLMTNGAPAAQHLDAIAYVSNPANNVPFTVWCVGRRDGYTAFTDHVAAVQAMRAAGRGFAFAWNDGNHSDGDILGSLGYLYNQFELGVGYPILTNCSHDKDPAVDLVGTINAGFAWRNVVETPTSWSCEITNTQATTVTVRPKSSIFTASVAPKVITIAAGLFAAVSFAATTAPPPPAPSSVSIVSRTVLRPKAIIMCAVMPDLSGLPIPVGSNATGDRYTRGQDVVELAGQTLATPLGLGPNVTIRGQIETTTAPQLTFGANWNAGLTFVPCNGGAPLVVATFPVLAAATSFNWTFDKSAIPEAWYWVTVTGMPTGWDVLEYCMYVRHTATAKPQALMPVISGSYSHSKTSRLSRAMVPAQFQPTMVPLAPRTYPAIINPTMAELAYTMLVPFKRDDIYRPSILPSGLWTTANIHNYFNSYKNADAPWLVLDGARGKGSLPCATDIRISRRPTGNKVGFVDAGSHGIMHDDGRIERLVGWVHDEPPPYANLDTFHQQRPPAKRRLVGDWSAVPVARHGVLEAWGLATDHRTETLNLTAPLIGGEPPHTGNIIKYMTETAAINPARGRVTKMVFDGSDRAKPAVVTEFVNLPGALPWGCETVGNLLLVTLSGTHMVNAYDMDAAGALVWSVPMLRPEGIREQDGVAYIGSLLTKAVWKLDLTTRVATKHIDLTSIISSQQSSFVNLAVSDGTLFPRGSVAVLTWSNNTYGWPAVFAPDGLTRLKIGARNMGWGEPKGMYVPDGLSYGSAVDIFGGRMVFATVQDALHQVSAALPTDLVVPASVALGAQEWHDRDFPLTNGDYGWGLYGVAQRWGVSANIDAMLKNMGHI